MRVQIGATPRLLNKLDDEVTNIESPGLAKAIIGPATARCPSPSH